MKIQLSFLKGISIIYLSFFLLFFNCSSDVDVKAEKMQDPLTDVLTLELSFGDDEEKLPEEFLLALPIVTGINVNEEGDIFVIDENCVKVYDREGMPKKIIGRQGQGPGEFEGIISSTISETGYLTVKGGGFTFHVFTPDYEFMKRYNYLWQNPYKKILDKMVLQHEMISGVVSFSGQERVYKLTTMANDYSRRSFFFMKN